MAGSIYAHELEQLKQYLKSDGNEDSKRPLLYPLFQKLYKDKFKIESAACGADVFIDGALIVESKTDSSQWLEGFYQALHYQKRFGLGYHTIMVIANKFVGIWKVNKLPEDAVIFAHTIPAHLAPSQAGKDNAKRTQKRLKTDIINSAFYFLTPKDLEGDIFKGAKNLTTESFEILKILKNIDSDRLLINTHNFIHTIERMKPMFEQPIDAVHAFYTIVAYWDITATVSVGNNSTDVLVIGFKGQKHSDNVDVPPRSIPAFKKLVETSYVFTNEGSGLTVDYYFSRFDEVLAKIDPEYVKQHGIFFTNDNLSKFALWYVQQQFGKALETDFIVFDPAGGSGNLVSSWKGRLKHKVISELQPDLLRIIERRMKSDPWHIDHGFTIIPKTSQGKGLNFLDQSAAQYLQALQHELAEKQVSMDKPIAFLLNPPYKNTDENVQAREASDAEYNLHPDILALTGEDAGKERYLAFLGQILLMSRLQYQQAGLSPLVMIFTPTSWLIPRPTYRAFREKWDTEFAYHSGFLVTSNEWFKLNGSWPLAFTIWQYQPNRTETNQVVITDLTKLQKPALNIDWNGPAEQINFLVGDFLSAAQPIHLGKQRGDIREILPEITSVSGSFKKQTRFDFSRSKKQNEEGILISGFPSNDKDRHLKLKRVCGKVDGIFLGFMDDNTPVRLSQDSLNRMSNLPDRIWLQLRPTFLDTNLTKICPGPPDKYGYCAYDLASAKACFLWFCITKSLNGVYPIWANQYDIWAPNIPADKEAAFYALCFAFVLAENRCVVTKFEANNPVPGAPEVFADNPLSPNNPECFWRTILEPYVRSSGSHLAVQLADAVTELYRYWNHNYTKGQFLTHVGLAGEAYFKYFSYPDFVTPNSGLIQIKKYAEENEAIDLIERFEKISAAAKAVKKAIYDQLVHEFHYFD